MKTTRTTRLAGLTLTLLALLLPAAAAAHSTHHRARYVHVPRLKGDTLTRARRVLAHHHLKMGRVTGTRHGIVNTQVPRAGRRVRRGSKVTLHLKARPATTTPTTSTAPTITTPTTSPAPTSVRAAIDPTYTLDVTTPQAPPVPVTIDYSATDANASPPLPDGELTLSIYIAGQAASSYGCEANVGGTITSATCDVELPQWGKYNLIVSYSSGVSNVAATGATTTIDLEPPAPVPVTQTQTITASWPADSPTISATVTNGTAAVTLSDPDGFNGATSVTLTDDLGDTCTATITGHTAACSMAVTGTPNTFTVGYPGASATTTSQSSAPDGWDDGQNVVTTTTTTTTWPASSYPVPAADTSVTVTPPPVTINWDGCSYQNGTSCPTNGPVSIAAGSYITLNAVGLETADTTKQAPGSLDFVMSSMTGVTMTDNTGVTTSPNCDAMSSYPGGAWGDCQLTFADAGTYTVQANYVSSDPADFPDQTGPSYTVNVS